MIESREVSIGDRKLQFMRMPLFNAPVLILKGSKGYVMCGYLNMEAAEKLQDAAVRVTGVNTLEDVLEAQVKETTSRARNLGISPGMKVREILQLIS
ncbi:MAG TPA: DUF1805 domain-containing protein [Thermoplasmataceae archaeon]|nr:DUF1805 domain-containing protein [Thermoplasmatales archaeon AK]HLH85787.1 DUF1805 domain-containing protein [Thermoplasmataceae archaeon]